MGSRLQLAGKTFGRWTVLRDSPTPPGEKQPKCLCRCECGVTKEVLAAHLRGGGTKSCGCLHREMLTTHGKAGSHIYTLWHNMMGRCYKTNVRGYDVYGGRGIRVFLLWHDFVMFETGLLFEIGPLPTDKHTIDRIDTNGDYEPGNVRWATRSEQAFNRRPYEVSGHSGLRAKDVASIRTAVTFGETQTSVAERYGVSQVAISNIINKRTWKCV